MELQEQPDPLLYGVRPTPITILCILFLLGGIFLCASNLIPGVMRDLNSTMAAWYPNYIAAFSVVTMACAIGLWRMQGWAFIVYGIVAALNQIVMGFVGDWRPSNLIVVGVFYFLLFHYFPRTQKQGAGSEQGGESDS